jgi:hypothetical protein
MVSFKVPHPIAKQRLDHLVSEFKAAAKAASEATGDGIATARSEYETLLERTRRVLRECLREKQDVAKFLSETQLSLGPGTPTRLDERGAVKAAAQHGYEILAEWVIRIERP